MSCVYYYSYSYSLLSSLYWVERHVQSFIQSSVLNNLAKPSHLLALAADINHIRYITCHIHFIGDNIRQIISNTYNWKDVCASGFKVDWLVWMVCTSSITLEYSKIVWAFCCTGFIFSFSWWRNLCCLIPSAVRYCELVLNSKLVWISASLRNQRTPNLALSLTTSDCAVQSFGLGVLSFVFRWSPNTAW